MILNRIRVVTLTESTTKNPITLLVLGKPYIVTRLTRIGTPFIYFRMTTGMMYFCLVKTKKKGLSLSLFYNYPTTIEVRSRVSNELNEIIYMEERFKSNFTTVVYSQSY